MLNMIKRGIIFSLFIGALAIFAGCGSSARDSFADAQEYFPQLRYIESAPAQPVRVNLYVQATADMLPLLNDVSHFHQVFTLLQNNAVDIWGTNRTNQYIFRFDVEWQENRFEEGYQKTAYHFAYPLDPVWWSRPDNVLPQVPQILTSPFFSIDWYLTQGLRAPIEYERRLEGTPPFSNHEQAHLSRTITEITQLRSTDNQISIVVTNFVGNEMGGVPAEDADIRAHILEYLLVNPDSSVGVLVFENNQTPFYLLMFGSPQKIALYASRLTNRLPLVRVYTETDEGAVASDEAMRFDFTLFTTQATASQSASNVSFENGNASADVTGFVLPVGLTQVFESDLMDGEAALFASHFGGTGNFFAVTGRADNVPVIQTDIYLHVPYLVARQMQLDNAFTLSSLENGVLSPRAPGNSSVEVTSVRPSGDGVVVTVAVNVDVGAIGDRGSRGVFSFTLYENLIFAGSLPLATNALASEVFNQLSIDTGIAAQRVRNEFGRHLVAEVYLFFYLN